MKYIRLLVISFVVLFLIVTGLSLFFPSHVHVSRAVQIASGKDSVWVQLANASHWKNWFPGADSLDFFIENDTVKGITTVKNKSIVLTYATENLIAAEMRSGSRKNTMGWQIMQNGERSVTVQWYMDFHLRWYPWEKFSGLLLDKAYGPQMEEGLGNLKKLVEN